MYRALILILFCLAIPPVGAEPSLPVEAFATPPDIADVRLSPDGNSLAFLQRLSEDGVYGTLIRVLDLEANEVKDLGYANIDNFVINWIRWANNDQLLMSAVYPATRGGVPTNETRLLALDIHTGEFRSVIPTPYFKKQPRVPQFQDGVVDLLSSDADNILLSGGFTYADQSRVLKINIRNGRIKTVHRDKDFVYDWMTDRQERLRLAFWRDTTEYRIMHKAVDSRKWETLWEFESFADDQVWPIGFGKNPDTLYVNAYHEGRRAIFKVNVSDPELGKELVFSDPNYDVSGSLVYSKITGDVIGARLSVGGGVTFWDEDYKSLQSSLDQSLPDTVNTVYDLSDNERLFVLLATSDTNAGTFYLVDRDENRVKLFSRKYMALDPALMAEKAAIRYRARDGLEIEGFLTVPKGEVDSPLPAIVFPHGGPISFNGGGFDYWTQYFASRGYVVLQMNFRGSSGYGYDFMASGLQSWGLEMQNDVEDGTRWLIEEGVADPERICVVGASYGGYAALMEAARNPDLYRCAISFAGVTDVAYLVKSSRRYTNYEIVQEQIGSDLKELRQRSPLSVADQIDIPVLLGHGTDDRSVRIQHGRRMYEELEESGKDVTYLEFEDGDHYLSNEVHRLQFFKAMDSFLDSNLK
jgi:dipeptidyl aminopeptidase/acylaminoacyl peptidase